MSLSVSVYGPMESEKILGTFGKNFNVVLVAREDHEEDSLYQELIDWLFKNDVCCRVMPLIEENNIICLMILFSSKVCDERLVRKTNDGYMLLKLTFSGHMSGVWHDDDYQKCQLVDRIT